jgi:hypothetical protein
VKRILVIALLFASALMPVGSARAQDGSAVDATVVANPLAVELSIHPATIGTGRFATARAIVTNVGETDLADVSVVLRADPTGLQLVSDSEQIVGTLPGGRSQSVRWRICGAIEGSYVVVAQAMATSASLGALFESESQGPVVTVETAPGRDC